MSKETISELFEVKPGKKVRLKDSEASRLEKKLFATSDKKEAKKEAELILEKDLSIMREAQELLYANNLHSILIIFQAMDAAGKDSMISHVMSGLNPQGCQVYSFKVPSNEELEHNFLWRYMKALPERGRIGIFNRSHYEEVLVVKVHRELLERQRLPDGKSEKELWKERYEDINNLELHLSRNGTLVLKFFLHISRDEQKERFIERLNNPSKNWKFSEADVRERSFWEDYKKAYEEALSSTSTTWAPWHIIPSDHKWAARTAVARIITEKIKSLKLRPPEVSEDTRIQLGKAKKLLIDESREK